jgi:diguanylate cyclase (GGDEF)-like protein/PAS domain S-box-containing protein
MSAQLPGSGFQATKSVFPGCDRAAEWAPSEYGAGLTAAVIEANLQAFMAATRAARDDQEPRPWATLNSPGEVLETNLGSMAGSIAALTGSNPSAYAESDQSALILDRQGNICYCNNLWMLGGASEELHGKPIAMLVPTLALRAGTPGYNVAYAHFWSARGLWQRHAMKILDGSCLSVEMCLSSVVLDGKYYLLLLLRSAAQARSRTETSQDLQRLFQSAETATEACFVTDLEGAITYANPAFEKLTGYLRSEVVGRTPRFLKSGVHDDEFFRDMWETLHGGRAFHTVMVNRRYDGAAYHEEKTVRPFFADDGSVTHFVSTGRDVSERYQRLQQLTYRANHDSLTGLPNRHLFDDRLQQAIARAERSDRSFCLLYVDLDRFKEVNDQFGHVVGDQLLRAATARLRQCVRDIDTVARLGGDEFALILEDVESRDSAERILSQLVLGLRNVVADDAIGMNVTASIGAALCPIDGSDQAILMARADIAMYQAKARGGNRYAFFGGGDDNLVAETAERPRTEYTSVRHHGGGAGAVQANA